jgi:transcriptional regulator with XRE-family HTH domain
MARRGPLPDLKRRELIRQLRKEGLTLEEIAAKLDCTKQAIARLARPSQRNIPLIEIRCKRCRKLIRAMRVRKQRAGRVSCLACLAQQPDPPFSERLLAHRIAAGLTQDELAARTGIRYAGISQYECGSRVPTWRDAARLVAVLGENLLLCPLPSRLRTGHQAERKVRRRSPNGNGLVDGERRTQ